MLADLAELTNHFTTGPPVYAHVTSRAKQLCSLMWSLVMTYCVDGMQMSPVRRRLQAVYPPNILLITGSTLVPDLKSTDFNYISVTPA